MLNVVELPAKDVSDVPRGLRQMADDIEAGKYEDVQLAWVMGCGNGEVTLGLLGKTASPGAEAHLLFAVAQRKLENPSV